MRPAISSFLVLCGAVIASADSALAQVSCDLAVRTDGTYSGLCLEGVDTVFRLNIKPPAEDRLWRGTVVDARGFTSSIGVDDSIFRYGRYWAQVSSFHRTRDSLSFSFPSTGSVEPSDADLAILRRAKSYLTEPGHWSRDPDPDVAAAVKQFLDKPDLSRGGFCPSRPERTLFCALYEASIEIAGEYWWGRPAINGIRAAVIAESAGTLQHPLMQFNAAPDTDIRKVERVLDVAIAFLKERRMCNVQYWVWSEMRSAHCQ